MSRLVNLHYLDLRARLAELLIGLGVLAELEKLDLGWNPLAAV